MIWNIKLSEGAFFFRIRLSSWVSVTFLVQGVSKHHHFCDCDHPQKSVFFKLWWSLSCIVCNFSTLILWNFFWSLLHALFLLHSISKLTQNENHKSTCCVIIKLSKKTKSLFFLLTSAERTFTYVCLSACVKNNNTLECQQCLGDFFKPEIYKGGSNVLTPKYGHVVIFFVAG